MARPWRCYQRSPRRPQSASERPSRGARKARANRLTEATREARRRPRCRRRTRTPDASLVSAHCHRVRSAAVGGRVGVIQRANLASASPALSVGRCSLLWDRATHKTGHSEREEDTARRRPESPFTHPRETRREVAVTPIAVLAVQRSPCPLSLATAAVSVLFSNRSRGSAGVLVACHEEPSGRRFPTWRARRSGCGGDQAASDRASAGIDRGRLPPPHEPLPRAQALRPRDPHLLDDQVVASLLWL